MQYFLTGSKGEVKSNPFITRFYITRYCIDHSTGTEKAYKRTWNSPHSSPSAGELWGVCCGYLGKNDWVIPKFEWRIHFSSQKLQSLPIVKSRHTCEQSVSSGLLARSECRESHVLRPFSNDDSGAMTETRHSLELQSQSTGVSSDRGEFFWLPANRLL